jgi:hypothetical protein
VVVVGGIREALMKTIHKLRLMIGPNILFMQISSPRCVLHIGEDGNRHPCIWYEADDSLPKDRSYRVKAYATGQEIKEGHDSMNFLGTLVDSAGFVWHFYSNEIRHVNATPR